MDGREVILSPKVQQQLTALKVWGAFIVTVVVFTVVGIGIWLNWDKMPFIGAAILVAVLILLACGVAVAIAATIKFVAHPAYRDVGEFGGYHTSLFGRVTAAPPMAAAPTKRLTSPKKKVEITPVFPGIVEMIEQGTIAAGMVEMVIGYTLKGVLILAAWPGTFIIAGLGRSGKTRRAIMLIIQALIAGARVTLCDPHLTKPDSLAKQLEALMPWLFCVASTNEEIVEASREFLAEMKARKKGTSSEWNGEQRGIPRLIIYDEWPALMTDKTIEDEDRNILIEVASDCSTQYAGFDGFAGLIGQKWTEQSVGHTDVRRGAHTVFVHRMNAEFARFFFRRAKWCNRIAEMPKQHCIFDNNGEIMEVITPEVPDDAAEKAAELLATIRNPEKQYQLAGQKMKVSLSQPSQKFVLGPVVQSEEIEAVNPPTEPLEAFEGFSEETEEIEVSGEGFTMTKAPDTPPAGYTEKIQTKIALACMSLQNDGKKVTRQAVREQLGWHLGYHPYVKYFFDHHREK